jgi:osmoprotectant transport system substrate-binding protein
MQGDPQVISIRPVLVLSIAGALVLSACGSDDKAASDDGVVVNPTINVGRTNDPVSQLLAEIYGQGLENAGYRVGRKDPVADQKAAIAGLEAGNLQLVPEFTGSLLGYLTASGATPRTTTTTEAPPTTVVTTDPPATVDTSTVDTSTEGTETDGTETEDTAADTSTDLSKTDGQMNAIRSELPEALTVGEAAGVDDGLVVVCGTDAIDKFSLTSIGDLADATDVKLGGTADFQSASIGGLAALNTAYDTALTLTTVPDVAAAVVDKTVDCGVVPALTPSIIIDGLIALTDDKDFAADSSLVALMTADAGQADVTSVIDAIHASLTTDVILALLVKVQVNDQPYDLIAKQFLASVSSGQ